MANNVNTNPVQLDTFSSDVTIRSGRVTIRAIYFETNTNNDRLVLEDNAGNTIWRQPQTADTVNAGTNYDQPAGRWYILPKENWIYADGLILDVSDGNYDGTCYALILI